ncbi:MAG: glycoprotein [Taraxacum cytorhabdovirus 1]|uniref:Glycoprotein n=1 Tax=Taraxacum cytorhabdovirus 1 TaxID=2950880 RepID=A0AAE9MP98_9RHAB|nr:MAG: glycoprotein [Taraxacum cytorhabdovirus 1]
MSANWFSVCLLIMTSYCLSTLSLSSEPPSEVYLRHTIAPVAICDDNKPVDPHKKIEECHTVCNFEPVSQGKAKVTIYKDNSGSKKYTAVMCEKWKLTQTFTQTWTFSTVKGDLVKERIKPSSDECTDLVGYRCPAHNCDYQLPTSLEEEYYYASTNTKTKEFVVLTTVPAIMLHYDGTFRIQIAHEKEAVRSSDSPWDTGSRVYMWADREAESCPFEAGMVVGCDRWKTGESMNYVCGNGRLAFEASGSIGISKHCAVGTRMSPEGIIYKEEKGEAATGYNAQRIAMVPDNKLSSDSETLRVLTSNSLMHLDSDMCSLGCEMSGLELRVARRQSTLIRTGAGYILLSPKGHGYDCAKAVQCSMVKPYKFCGNPPRIHVMCDGKFYFWDPTQSYILLDNGCHAPSQSENLYIHLGSKKYLIDDDLTIEVHTNETDSVRTVGYAINKGSLINYEDIPEIKASWVQAKGTQRSSIETNTTKDIDQHSLFNYSWLSPLKAVSTWVSNSINNIERGAVVLIIIIACVYISKPIISYILNQRHDVRAFSPVGIRRRRNEGVYEVEMI